MSIEQRSAELVRRTEIWKQKLEEQRQFFQHAKSLLNAHHVHTVADLPPDVRKSIAEKLAKLTPEHELERERIELERMEAELIAPCCTSVAQRMMRAEALKAEIFPSTLAAWNPISANISNAFAHVCGRRALEHRADWNRSADLGDSRSRSR
jgi:hypothetical protein